MLAKLTWWTLIQSIMGRDSLQQNTVAPHADNQEREQQTPISKQNPSSRNESSEAGQH